MNPDALPTVLVSACERGARLGLVLLVRIYRWILSPLKTNLLGNTARCRFAPSCSEYALIALQRHGAIRGSLLAGHRICRCHPWGGQGYDPVPEAPQASHPTSLLSPAARGHRRGSPGHPGLPV